MLEYLPRDSRVQPIADAMLGLQAAHGGVSLNELARRSPHFRRFDSAPAPAWSELVSVGVRKAPGVFFRTRIVTLAPRFVLSNHTNKTARHALLPPPALAPSLLGRFRVKLRVGEAQAWEASKHLVSCAQY